MTDEPEMSYFLTGGSVNGNRRRYLIPIGEGERTMKYNEIKNLIERHVRSDGPSDFTIKHLYLIGKDGRSRETILEEDGGETLLPDIQLRFVSTTDTLKRTQIVMPLRYSELSLSTFSELHALTEDIYIRVVAGFQRSSIFENRLITERLKLYKETILNESVKENRRHVHHTFCTMIGTLRDNIARRRIWAKIRGFQKMKHDICFRAFHALLNGDRKGKFLVIGDFEKRLKVPPKKLSQKVINEELFYGFLERFKHLLHPGYGMDQLPYSMTYDLFDIWCSEHRYLAASIAQAPGYETPSKERTDKITIEIKLNRAVVAMNQFSKFRNLDARPPSPGYEPHFPFSKESVSFSTFSEYIVPLGLTLETAAMIFNELSTDGSNRLNRKGWKRFHELYPCCAAPFSGYYSSRSPRSRITIGDEIRCRRVAIKESKLLNDLEQVIKNCSVALAH
eukprot:TRINITY_DN18789_c0_g1_i1.p1 TRINITY_DN18789_c0_g1~~TRINITY_DN18789_c0_g1_i1.p1  ORF type:complete len:465 (+),score=19.64 TRINITY_DN18789_c0_g1_i1:47-1396(+)